jgi:hypothetical protein
MLVTAPSIPTIFSEKSAKKIIRNSIMRTADYNQDETTQTNKETSPPRMGTGISYGDV